LARPQEFAVKRFCVVGGYRLLRRTERDKAAISTHQTAAIRSRSRQPPRYLIMGDIDHRQRLQFAVLRRASLNTSMPAPDWASKGRQRFVPPQAWGTIAQGAVAMETRLLLPFRSATPRIAAGEIPHPHHGAGPSRPCAPRNFSARRPRARAFQARNQRSLRTPSHMGNSA